MSSGSAAPTTDYPQTRRAVNGAFVVLAGLLFYWAWQADLAWYEHHMLWACCAFEPGQFAGFARYRWAAVALGVLLLLVARPFVARRAARVPPGAAIGHVVRIGLAIVMSVVAADVILRIGKKKHGPHGQEMPLSVVSKDFGWVHETSKSTVITYGDRKVEYVTDAEGNRVSSATSPTDFTQPAILFPGESITLGFGLAWDETYVAIVGRLMGAESVNLAVTAYSNDQSYARLKQQLPRFAKPLAVVTLMVHGQTLRNTDRRLPHVLADGEVVPISSRFFLDSPTRDLVENKIGYHSTEHIRIARDVIRATVQDARARGVYPLFVLTNWKTPCLPHEDGKPILEHDLFDGLDAPHIRVDLDPLDWDVPSDHPAAASHARLADAIVAALRAAGVGAASSTEESTAPASTP